MNILNRLVDGFMRPFAGGNAWWGMLWFALIGSLLLLATFMLLSRPAQVRRRRHLATARLLEMWLYRHDTVLSLRSGIGAMWNGLRYAATLFPAMLGSLPVALYLFIQAQAWFDVRPVRPGESLLLIAHFRAGQTNDAVVGFETSAGISPDIATVHSPELRETAWRLTILPDTAFGTEYVNVRLSDGTTVNKRISVRPAGLFRTSSLRVTGRWHSMFFTDAPRLPSHGPLESVVVRYPGAHLNLGGWTPHWLTVLLVVSIPAGLFWKRMLKVEL